MVGQAVAFAPDYQKAKIAAARIFKLLDLKPKIDAFSTSGRMLVRGIYSLIEIILINFTYFNQQLILLILIAYI